MIREFKNRLLRHLRFLEDELKDYDKFKKLTQEQYFKSRDKRRNVERWIENIINSTVDISKVILTYEDINIPDTYRGIVSMISIVKELGFLDADELSKWVRFRNIVTHEYLDLKWGSIHKFINNTNTLFNSFLYAVKQYMKSILALEKDKDSDQQ